MSDAQTLYLLDKIAESLESILQRAEGVHSTDDLLSSPGGMLLLDGYLHEAHSRERKHQATRQDHCRRVAPPVSRHSVARHHGNARHYRTSLFRSGR